ncbi:alpha/beta hydrolase [Marivirga lumbricoides]|uniref:Alpha/beta hydrolase n=1 Tax=Marivirga lumbricoides TaxID=1046115 RepID=A0ABQ1LQK1_9BACT|nr:alpha/beta hydrolase [Marivirga lumbricoides]
MKKLIYQSIGFYLNTLSKISPERGAKVGFKLFCTPQRTKLRKNHLLFLSTARQEDFNFNGINIKIYQWGSGPKRVLFVHGWQSHSYRWKKYIQGLSEDEYTLIAYDAPGHGLSGNKQFTVPLNAYLLSLLSEKYNGFDTVIAHSIGSMSVLYANVYHPQLQIDRLVLMASPAKAEEFFQFYLDSLNLEPRTMEGIVNEFQLYAKQEIKHISASTYVQALHIPGLIIHDKDDSDTPYTNALALEKNWRKGKLITTEGLGHNLKSEEVVQLVIQYLQNSTADKQLIA